MSTVPLASVARRHCVPGFCVVALVGCVLLSGCGHKREWDNDPVYPVTGKLLVDGAPLEPPYRPCVKAYDVDNPLQGLADDNKTVVSYPVATAWVKPDGSFELSTYAEGDGLRAGNYQLTFEAGKTSIVQLAAGDLFEGRYADPETSEYTVTVTGSETEPIDLGPIELSAPEGAE